MENLITAQVKLTGTGYLTMNNIDAADPDRPLNREHAALVDAGRGKNKRTDVQEERKRHVEWERSLYLDVNRKIVFPVYSIFQCLCGGARSYRLGSTVERAVTLLEDTVPLEYKGESDIDELWKSGTATWTTIVNGNPSSGKGSSKVPLTRPRFRPWGLQFTAEVDTEILSWPDFEKVVTASGRGVGIGNARKLGHGRFTAEIKPI